MRYVQEQVAKICGVSQGSVSNWENLKTQPTGLSRAALKEHFPDWLKELEERWKEKVKKSS